MQKLIVSILFLLVVVSCKKSTDTNLDLSSFAEVEVSPLQEQNSTYYIVKSKLNINPNERVTEYGFVYSYSNTVFNEIFNDSLKIFYTFNGNAEQSQVFEDTIYHMGLPTAYTLKPYAVNGGRITFGKESKITPPVLNIQKITTPSYTDGAINPFALSNGTLAIVGGGKDNRLYTKIDGTTLAFTEPADTLPVDFANEHAATFTLGNFGFVVGGLFNGSPSDQVYRYDFSNNSWTKMQNFPGGARFAAIAAVVDNKAYVGFGGGSGSTYADLWEYDLQTDTWSKITISSAEIKGRNMASSFVIGKNIYVVGGGATASLLSGVFENNLWQYNTEKKEWKVLPDCPFTSGFCFGFSYKNEGYIGFGKIANKENLMVGYNESNGKWFGYSDGSNATITTVFKSFAFSLNQKYFVANFGTNELLRVK